MLILIVEDEGKMASLLERGLKAEGHCAIVAHSGTEALEVALAGRFDAIVLDVMLPQMDGFEVAHRLREHKNQTPILMLTARDAPSDKVRGLDWGADDYLTKPFLFAEFLARLRAVSRRGPILRPPSLRVANLVLNAATREVSRNGQPISLTKTEFSLLELLMRNTGRVLTRDDILETIWSTEDSVEGSNLNAFISLLRRKIDGGHRLKLIQTVRGIGYRIAGGGE
ncbi:MAG: response regulator transcription factor [Acidobacteriota bacterium]|nr:response regulator transcription factor [Acidobacteriota bacterium]